MTTRERKIIRRYAKIIGLEPKLCLKVYEHADSKQREIDMVGIECTIWLKEKQKNEGIEVEEDGKISQEMTNKLIQEFIKEKYGNVKNMPKFFSLELPEIMKLKNYSPDDLKKEKEIEEVSPEYLSPSKID